MGVRKRMDSHNTCRLCGKSQRTGHRSVGEREGYLMNAVLVPAMAAIDRYLKLFPIVV